MAQHIFAQAANQPVGCTGMAQMQYTPDDGRVLFARELLA
jgi:hypothetical protein